MVRTSGLPRRLHVVRGLLFLGGWLFATSAWSGWTGAVVTGEVNDVQIWGPGSFTVSTTQGAHHFMNGVQEGAVYDAGANVAGAFWTLNGCLITIVNPSGAVRSSCGGTDGYFGNPVLRVRHVEQGGPGYLAYNNLSALLSILYLAEGVSPSATASPVQDLYVPLWPMDVARGPSSLFPYAVFQVESGGTANTALMMAHGSADLSVTPYVVEGADPAPASPVRELELLVVAPGGEDLAHVFIAAPNGLYRIDTSPIGSSWTSLVRIDAVEPGRPIVGLGLSQALGAPTMGHGMLLIQDATRTSLRRAVPAFRGGTPGSVWVDELASVPAPPPGMTPRLVSCEGAHTCVVAHSGGGQTHLAIYRNLGGPSPSITAEADSVEEGEQVRFTAAGLVDPDGDPLAVRWGVKHGAVEVLGAVSADGTRVTVETLGLEICGPPETLLAQLEVSDGLHSLAQEGTVSVSRTRSPKILPDSGALEVGESVALEVVADDFAVCAPSEYAWEVEGPGTLSTTTGTVTTLTADGPACSPTGASIRVEVDAMGRRGRITTPAAIFSLPPWGPAPEPFPGAAVEQHAGTTRHYRPQAHVCLEAGGFPGQRTQWRLLGTLPAGVTLADGRGQPVPSNVTSFDADELRVAADSCAEGTVTFEVTSGVEGISGSVRTSILEIQVVRFSPPIDEAELTLNLERFEGGVLTGRLGTNVSCPAAAGWRAELVVLRAGVPLLPPVQISPDGPFELRIPGLCAGGSFTLQATLVDPSGTRGTSEDAPFTAEPAPVRVGSLVDSVVRAGCGEGARGGLTLQPPVGSCLGANWTWTQIGGPTLSTPVLEGASVQVHSSEKRELGELIGQTLRFEVIAEAEGLPPELAVIEIPIGSEVLASVAARAETALVRSDTFVGARLEVRNLTTCGLPGLEVQGLIGGATPAGGEVAVEGSDRAARWDAPRLIVGDVDLAGQGELALELLLRPGILGVEHTRISGEVFLNGVRISEAAPGGDVRTDEGLGCGCNGTTGAGWSLPLLLLAGMLLRGRRSATRSH